MPMSANEPPVCISKSCRPSSKPEGSRMASRSSVGQNYPNSDIPEIGHNMETVKLGKKGQMSIPKGIRKRLGLEGDVTLLVDTTPDGAIVLRPAAVYPIEIYSEKRVREFDAADRMDAKTAARLAKILEGK
jgi:AbrB family looped-hinge helix DNA binding protein